MQMDSKKMNDQGYVVLDRLCCLPQKMLALKNNDNVSEFVMYELCSHCFGINRAAYFVDNPDFNCLKGVAGYSREEPFEIKEDIWANPKSFSDYMQKAEFNQQVRKFQHPSVKKHERSDDEIVEEIAKTLGLGQHGYYAWDMKHDNHGIFVYEKSDEVLCDEDYLKSGLSLLGFCPVY